MICLPWDFKMCKLTSISMQNPCFLWGRQTDRTDDSSLKKNRGPWFLGFITWDIYFKEGLGFNSLKTVHLLKPRGCSWLQKCAFAIFKKILMLIKSWIFQLLVQSSSDLGAQFAKQGNTDLNVSVLPEDISMPKNPMIRFVISQAFSVFSIAANKSEKTPKEVLSLEGLFRETEVIMLPWKPLQYFVPA